MGLGDDPKGSTTATGRPRFSAADRPDVRCGSKSEKLHASICFPLFTQQRTSPRYFGMSVSCGGLNRSTQHFILEGKMECSDGSGISSRLHGASESALIVSLPAHSFPQ